MKVWDAPGGRGPYGIATAPDGSVYYASLAGSHIARVDLDSGTATVLEPPTKNQGARRVWADSRSRIWVSEWNSGNVSRYDPRAREWKTWKLPGEQPRAYAVYVDDRDKVWLSDWGSNSMVRFDPDTERFETFRSESKSANVRQLLGQPGEVCVPESGADRLLVFRTR
jgi:virginiamycin B lyase